MNNIDIANLIIKASKLHQKGDLLKAKSLYEEVIKLQPINFDANHLLGVIALQEKNFQHAIDLINNSIKINNKVESAYKNLGAAYIELKNYKMAANAFSAALELNSKDSQIFYNLGCVYQFTDQYDTALEYYNKSIEINPNNNFSYFNKAAIYQAIDEYEDALNEYKISINKNLNIVDSLYNSGLIFQKQNNRKEAIKYYKRVLEINPRHTEALNNTGNILMEMGLTDEAIKTYNNIIVINDKNADAYNNLGNALLSQNKIDDAIFCFDKAIEIDGNYKYAFNNKGNALNEKNLIEEAIISYRKAVLIDECYIDAINNLGGALSKKAEYEDALVLFDQALNIQPNNFIAHYNKGVIYQKINNTKKAIEFYKNAISFNENYTEAYNNLGILLHSINELNEAITCFQNAIKINEKYTDAYNNLGNVFQHLKKYEEALNCFIKVLNLEPEYEYVQGIILHLNNQLCNWTDYKNSMRDLREKLSNSQRVAPSFPVLSFYDSPYIQKIASHTWVSAKCPVNKSLGSILRSQSKAKIRIGYFSADFHNHATAYLMADLFESYSRDQFEIVAFSFGPDKQDEMRQRLTQAFTQFLDVRNMSDEEVAKLSRQMQIDIAVDLKGFTHNERAGIFSYRCAPIQVNYLGYPGTMAAEYIDYIIADPTLIPPESKQFYSEKIVYLPNSYQVNDTKRKLSDKVFTKAELGLPETGFVFCCFNNNYKITPDTFDGWMRLLRAVDGSVLWLFEDNATAASNLRKEAEARGVSQSRLVFAQRMPLPEHLARHRVADLFLDTLPYNAHTTASDSLWAGLPVLTLMGESFAARVAASLLNAIELPELITHTQEEYETRAIELATKPKLLAELKQKLAKNKLTTPLFNTTLFTKHIESAYKAMYDRYQNDLPPDHIYVPEMTDNLVAKSAEVNTIEWPIFDSKKILKTESDSETRIAPVPSISSETVKSVGIPPIL